MMYDMPFIVSHETLLINLYYSSLFLDMDLVGGVWGFVCLGYAKTCGTDLN